MNEYPDLGDPTGGTPIRVLEGHPLEAIAFPKSVEHRYYQWQGAAGRHSQFRDALGVLMHTNGELLLLPRDLFLPDELIWLDGAGAVSMAAVSFTYPDPVLWPLIERGLRWFNTPPLQLVVCRLNQFVIFQFSQVTFALFQLLRAPTDELAYTLIEAMQAGQGNRPDYYDPFSAEFGYNDDNPPSNVVLGEDL